MNVKRLPKGMLIFFFLAAFIAIGNGFSDSIYANYFNDAYHVDTIQRGIIEFPRELPGVFCALVIALLASLGDLKLGLIAQILAFIGLTVLAFTTPSFGVMLIFLFINSLGMHLFFPLQDAIGMSLSEPHQIGKRMGQFASMRSVIGVLCAITVFFGFRTGFFSFTTPIKRVFLFGSAGFACAIITALVLIKQFKSDQSQSPTRKFKLLFRREYKYYYALTMLHGVQKQITYVYGSWVIIRMLGQGADTMSLLYIAANLLGIFFVQFIGRWLDRFGIKRMMFVGAFSFIGVYVTYGLVVLALFKNILPASGGSLILVSVLFVLDRMSIQCALVNSVYLRSIALDGNDLSPTLSTGTSLDHIVAIIAAPICGVIWANCGPHWVFFIATVFSLGNVFIAWRAQPEAEARRAAALRTPAQ